MTWVPGEYTSRDWRQCGYCECTMPVGELSSAGVCANKRRCRRFKRERAQAFETWKKTSTRERGTP